ncbi:MAG: hypothetical protein QM658_12125, partial [Gordonia sp. (in: high G+C Gram-positive bacteria)]
IGDDHYAPILDRPLWDKVMAVLTDPARQRFVSKDTPRPSVAAGILRCDACSSTMFRAGPDWACDNRDCPARPHVRADPVEAEISERVLTRITSDAWLTELRRAVDRGRDHYLWMRDTAAERMRTLAETFGAGDTERAALDAGLAAARGVIAEADHGLEFLDAAGSLAELSDAQVVAWWADAPVTARHDVVKTVVDWIDVTRPAAGRGVADRLVWHWR